MAKKEEKAEGAKEGPLGPTLVSHLKKEFGQETAHLASEELDSDIREYVSTQCATLDYCIGRPGIPVGRLTVLYGKEGSGKSTVAYHILAETLRRGGVAMLIDSEGAFDRDRGRRLGLDDQNPSFIVLEPPTMEACFAEIEDSIKFIREETPDTLLTIVWDTLAASPTKALMESDYDAIGVARASRVVSDKMPRLNKLYTHERVALVIVNQVRQYINFSGDPRSRTVRKVMGQNTMIGEGALIFYGSLFLHFQSAGYLGEKEKPHGITTKARGRKNKIAPNEGWTQSFDILYKDGIDVEDAKLRLLKELGIITVKGSWYVLGDQKFQRKQWSEVLAEHPELEEQVREAPLLWEDGE